MAIQITRTNAALGAEVSGVDLKQELSDDAVAQIRNALFEYGVIIIRGCVFDAADHVRFNARFGEPVRSKMTSYLLKEYPDIFMISNIKENGKSIGVDDAGLFWHTDGAFFKRPHGASMLHALEVPHDDSGRALGDTRFASAIAAYEGLSAEMKQRIEGLQAVHSLQLRTKKTMELGVASDVTPAVLNSEIEGVQPVVRPHPITGRKCLYVSEGYTERILGLPEGEAAALLAELVAHVVKPEYVYRHSWRVHDLVIWDNHCTQHKATFDYALPQRRRMERSAVIY